MSSEPAFITLPPRPRLTADAMIERATTFCRHVSQRRTVRDFDNQPVPRAVIEQCILAAGSAPSGANLQPWHFVAVSDQKTKRSIRIAAEHEERDFYEHRAPAEWLNALAPLGVDANKPFLERAPYLIAIFRRTHEQLEDGKTLKQYYSAESVGIATGILITALHGCGLATLTHTPSPMSFLNDILERPTNERPFLLLVTGFAANDARVPDIHRKSLEEIASFIE